MNTPWNAGMERPKAKANEPSTDAPDDPNRRRRVQATYDEAVVQGEVLRAALESEAAPIKATAQALAGQPVQRILLLGCGDSWFAGMGIRLALESLLGVPVEPFQALDFALYYAPTAQAGTLAIGISSGGNTPAVMEALRAARRAGAVTLGVSNTPDTPILTEFDHALLVRATRKGWPTQASTAAMGVLLALALELARLRRSCPEAELASFAAALEALPAQMERTLALAAEPVQALAERLAEARFLFFCAGGPALAAAAFGAAKVKELCPIHAEVIPLEEFHHYRTLKPGDPLLLLAPDAASHPRALDTAQVGRYDGGQIFALVPEGEQEIAATAHWSLPLPPVDPRLAGLLYSLPLHLLAYHLAMQKFERGLSYTPAFPSQD